MKKFLILILIATFALTINCYAQTYNMSQIHRARLLKSYSSKSNIQNIDAITFGNLSFSTSPALTTMSVTKPAEWVVLDRDNDKALLLMLNSNFYFSEEDITEEDFVWEDSNIRRTLNTKLFNGIFNNAERNLIMQATLLYEDDASHSINDRIFLLNLNEIKKYFPSGTDYPEGSYMGLAVKYYSHYGMEWVDGSYSGGINQLFINETTFVDENGNIIHNTRYLCPAIWVNISGRTASNLSVVRGTIESKNISSPINFIAGLPSRESELRSDNHFYLDNNMQKSTWVYYKTYYYHVDGNGNIQKNQWIELRYVGDDGRMYRGRQTPDGKWVGDDGLVVDTGQDLSNSLTIEAAEPDSWYRTQSGLWYYFENDRTTTKRGWFTDARDNQTYYFDPLTGIMAVGWTKIDGNEYYFNEYPAKEQNWYETGDGFYESYGKKIKAYGSMFKAENTPDGRKVDASGKLIQESRNTSAGSSNSSSNSSLGSQIKNVKLVTEYSQTTTVDSMDTVTFGSYYQSSSSTKDPVEWLVLDRQNGKALLLSKYILDCKQYNEELKDVTWETCTLRKWLNNTFIKNAFNNEEQNIIQSTNLINSDNVIELDDERIVTKGGNTTTDKIFCISLAEAEKYFYQPLMQDKHNGNLRLATRATNDAKSEDSKGNKIRVSNGDFWHSGNSSWLLRSPGQLQNQAARVLDFGYLYFFGEDVDANDCGVRPAMWVSYE